MKEKIIKELEKVEQDQNIKILLAVESGSRGWGFESTDSDYDVRFIYIYPPDCYLSISNKRDVIEYPINNLLDVSGWDIRKALNLFRKSNPSLFEWLRSPIIYIEKYDFAENLRKLSSEFFSPKTCLYHYLHMANGNYRNYLVKDMVRTKKYFYVLRPILACLWIEKHDTFPPMEFEKLMNDSLENGDIKSEINKLLERKRAGEEFDKQPKIEVINQYLENKLNHFTQLIKQFKKVSIPNIEILDNLFRKTLEYDWDKTG